MNTKKLPILQVVQINDLPRFVIQDQRERIWTGDRFSSMHNGELFARHNDAAVEAQNILKRTFGASESVKYVVPVFIEVHSHEPVVVSEVAKYLSESARLYINTTEHGNGPGNSLVLPTVHWHRIEQMKEFPSE